MAPATSSGSNSRARVVRCENHGFPHANNRALMSVDARYVLFLNPDTEVIEGTFGELLDRMDALPNVGLGGLPAAPTQRGAGPQHAPLSDCDSAPL